MRFQKRSPKAAKFSVPKSGTTFPVTNIHRCYLSTNHRNRTAECIVYPSGIGEQRENNDAPETDFDRRFPHEPLQEQTKEAAGQALPRTGQAFLKSIRDRVLRSVIQRCRRRWGGALGRVI